MKQQKMLSLDHEVVNRLKEEENASGLVNSMLVGYYKTKRRPDETNEERKAFLINEIARRKLKKKHDKEMEKLTQ